MPAPVPPAYWRSIWKLLSIVPAAVIDAPLRACPATALIAASASLLPLLGIGIRPLVLAMISSVSFFSGEPPGLASRASVTGCAA